MGVESVQCPVTQANPGLTEYYSLNTDYFAQPAPCAMRMNR